MSKWYRDTFLWGQTNLTEDDPQHCDLEFWRAYWKKTGIEGVIINCGGIVSYYNSDLEGQYTARMLHGRDYFGLWNAAARQDGLHVIARMDINATGLNLYEKHPEWYCRDRDGSPVMSQGRYVTCVNGGYYRDFLPVIFREIIDKYHPDGFADNSWAGLTQEHICYCDSCRKAFYNETGNDLPQKADWEDPVYRSWVRWGYALRVELWDYFNRITQEAGGEDCRWFGMLTADPFDTGGRFYDLRRLAARSVFIFSDQQGRDEGNGFEQNALNGNLLRSCAGDDVVMTESMAHYYKGLRTFRLSSAPRQEVRKWMLTGLAGGITPWYHFVGGNTRDRRKFHISDDLFHLIKQQETWVTDRKNCAAVGLVWNQESAVYYGRGHGRERCGYPFTGFLRALSRAGIPVIPVHSADMERCSDQLSCLILPETAILNRSEEEALIRCLESGKGLVMTGRSGRYDSEGRKRGQEDCLLWEYLHLTSDGTCEGVQGHSENDWKNHVTHNYLRIEDAEHPVLSGFEDTDLIGFGGEVLHAESRGPLKKILSYIPPFPIYPPEFAWIPKEEEETGTVFAGELAGGARVVYLAADVDRCYARFWMEDHGKILENAVRYAAADRFPVQVQSVGHIQCDAYRQGERLIIHLVNLNGCDGPVGSVTYNLDGGPVTVRLRDIPLKQEAVSLVTGKPVSLLQEGEDIWFTLDQLGEQDWIIVG